mgnify:CR=1 FL=1
MRRLIAALFLLTLTGCATVGTKETFALCQAADAATTVLVLGKGGAEANPLMGKIIAKAGFAGLFAVKLALIALVWEWATGQEDDKTMQGMLTAANVVTCGVAIHNTNVLGGMK